MFRTAVKSSLRFSTRSLSTARPIARRHYGRAAFVTTVASALFLMPYASAVKNDGEEKPKAEPKAEKTEAKEPEPKEAEEPAPKEVEETEKTESSETEQPQSEEPAEGSEGEGQSAAFNPETGEINWDCPCLGGMAHGPCGEEFKAAFSCFVYSETEPKGIDCIEKFEGMRTCFKQHPEHYKEELYEDDEPVPSTEKDSEAEKTDKAETKTEETKTEESKAEEPATEDISKVA